jgi:hypothetical protein
MDSSLSLHLVSSIWIIAGVAAVIVPLIAALKWDSDEWGQMAILLAVTVAGSGVTTMAVALNGWTSVALYVWSFTAIIGLLMGLAALIRTIITRRDTVDMWDGPPGSQPPNAQERRRTLWAPIAGTVAMGAMVWLSFQSNSLSLQGDAIGLTARSQVLPTISAGSILWIGTLVLLVIGTIYFLFLYVQRLKQGGTPQIETHWGGIGGGLGGWRMSSALGYLIVSIALAVLFTVFLLQFDQRERDRVDKKTEASPALSPTVTPTPVAPRRDSTGTGAKETDQSPKH